MFAVKAKIYRVLYNPSSSFTFDKTSSYWSAQKAPNFWAFHWPQNGSRISIGQHFVTTMIVHLPKRTETSLITEADLVTESDQAVWAVHSCNSWFMLYIWSFYIVRLFPTSIRIIVNKHETPTGEHEIVYSSHQGQLTKKLKAKILKL